ncbi:lamin Dm0-like [Mizuhopecten yessoensis]|uniref:Lamin Dm0 n=1 Tax=Mizuhopecten yessoensis TaxID=6573 RepID=A0A210QIG1_MIZYE|nr:lamin Dm0-like [Mizuhopecten yessoensis]OWF48530.1 Lamin Dm0 [Mizuhopecten yessoensis]
MASKTGTPTKSSKRTVTTTTYTQRSSDETPSTSSASPGRRVRSPSPARITRQIEKDQLLNLNDRLAAYIDRVRFLETENSRLTVQIKSVEETVNRDRSNIKAVFQTEIDDARRLLDETAKEKARLQIEVGKYKEESEDWKLKYHKKDRELRDSQNQNAALLKENADLENRATNAENQRKLLEKECNKLRSDLAALERQLATAKKQLEDETLLRVDLQNRIQSLKEDLSFKTQVYEQELNETRVKTTQEIEEVDSSVRMDYEAKLQDALQSLREEQDIQLREVRLEVESLYERKVGDVQSALDRSMNSSNMSSQDLLSSRKRLDEMSSELTRLRAENAAYISRITDLEAQLARDQEEFLSRLAMKDQEIGELRIILDEQTQEYADLLDVKVKLDNEIMAYRKLLEGEEERLNLSQSSSSSESTPGRSGARGAKRKRVALSDTVEEFSQSSSSSGFATTSSASGHVEIKETDGEGKFIKIYNTSDEDIAVGGWQLKHTAGKDDSEKSTLYKFHRSLLLRANQACTVWSSGMGQTHSPPSDLVMKTQQWVTDGDMKTVLVNSDGEEVASREMSKTLARSTQSFRTSRGFDDVDTGRGSDRCSIM